MKIPIIIISILCSRFVFGQDGDKLTAGQILDRSIRFCGGENRIAKIQTASINYIVVQPDKSTGIVTEKRKIGKKYTRSFLSKAHAPQTIFFDGKVLSEIEGASVVQTSSLEKVEEIKLKTYNQIQYGYKVLGYELSRLPDQKFQYFDCYVVNAKASNGYTTMNFFDKANYRLLMVVYPSGNKSLMMDYVFKDSVLFNSRMGNTYVGSEGTQELRLRNLLLNDDINDLWFSCPYSNEVTIPLSIKEGKFESSNGPKTIFIRNKETQDYFDEQGKFIMRRFLKWASNDTLGLIDEKAIQTKDTSPESEILVRIISWDKYGFVCHWIAGKYTDTQDYRIKD